MKQSEALGRINLWLLRQTKPYNLVVVAGGTCSGKTYFSQVIARHFGADTVSVIRLDDYFKDFDDPTLPRDPDGYPLFDTPDSYHIAEFVHDIEFLLAGTSVWVPSYDLATNRRHSPYNQLTPPRRLIVAEGLHAIHLLNRPYLKINPLTIYVDVPDNVRLARRVKRDMVAYGVPYQVIIDVFYDRLLPLHYRFVEPQKVDASLIVEGIGD